MGIWDEFKKIFTQKEVISEEKKEGTMSEEKKMTPEEVNEYMNKVMGFTPRMFKIINTVTPDPGKTFADFYATIFGEGALSKKVKELMFTAIGVAYCSPRCIIHVIPAINAGGSVGRNDRSRLCPGWSRYSICI
jgi:alkylhydroperoxidase/carboxymuconolactone decarboxylase family protein YurZ